MSDSQEVMRPDATNVGESAKTHSRPNTARAFLTALRYNVVAQIAVVLLAAVVIVGIFAPLIAPFDPTAQNLAMRLRPPAWLHGSAPGHLLGTDDLGRDVLSRLIYGTRISLLVGVAATLCSGVIGTVFGLISGYFRGPLDAILMRLADIQLAFPTILLALVVVAVAQPSVAIVVIVLGINGWMNYARVIRSQVLSLRTSEYVQAVKAVGGSSFRIVFRHLLPNVAPSLATVGTLQVAAMIIAESSLSYLGLGVPPETPTWGGMLASGQLYIGTAWWLAVFSGVAIVLTTLSINIAGDMLRDVSDPKRYR